MRYGIFSDVHGNLEAMEALRRAFTQEGIDQYYCVGDVVGYGANPHECIEEVKKLQAVCVAGNHDWAVLGKTDTRFFNPVAKAAVNWTAKNISRDDIDFLEGLDLTYKNEDFILVHGTLQEASQFHYLFDIEQAVVMFELMDRNVSFIGHTHVPGIFLKESNHINWLPSFEVNVKDNGQYIINVGSVGQPRDGDPRAAYCLFDTKEKIISVKRIDYDIESAQRKIIEAGLPSFLAHRLKTGQ